MEKVRIGIVGIGNMGSAHAVSVYAGRIEGLTLAAVCDIDEAKCRWAAQHLPGVPCYTDYEDMLAETKLDAVLIAAPHYAHPPMAEAAFARGLHVLTEKPLGVSARRAGAVLDAAKAAGTVFGIMYNQRTNPLFARAKELLQAGRLGRRKRLVWIITNWYRTQAYYDSGSWRASWAGEGGGVLINQCPHNLDLWQWIYGMPTRIRADCGYGRYHHIEVEDDVTAYAEYEDGGTATFIATTGECPGTNRLEMSGDRGKIVIEDGVLKFWELEQPERDFCFSAPAGFGAPKYTYTEYQPDGEGPAHNGILQNFTRAVLYGEPLLAPGEEGINGLRISNAIHLSSWTGGGFVPVPPDGEAFDRLLQERIDASGRQPSFVSRLSSDAGQYSHRWKVKW